MKNWFEDRKLFPGFANCYRVYNAMSKDRNKKVLPGLGAWADLTAGCRSNFFLKKSVLGVNFQVSASLGALPQVIVWHWLTFPILENTCQTPENKQYLPIWGFLDGNIFFFFLWEHLNSFFYIHIQVAFSVGLLHISFVIIFSSTLSQAITFLHWFFFLSSLLP